MKKEIKKEEKVNVVPVVLSREEKVAQVVGAIKAAKHQREADELKGIFESDSDKAARVLKEYQDIKDAHNS
jgi:hypothetical protein